MVGASRISVTGFPIFMKLPPELRSEIWCNALPDTFKPAFFLYTRGCWHLLDLTDYYSDVQHGPVDATKYKRLEFRHKMLGNVQIDTPLVSVNHEARRTALKRAHTKGFFVQIIEGYPIISRSFNPGRDILYIPPGEELSFRNEPSRVLEAAGFVGQRPLRRTWVKNFAIAESALENNEPSYLCEMFNDFLSVEMLVIVIETPSEIGFFNRNSNLQERWERSKGGAYDWDNEEKIWRFHGRKFRGKLYLYELVDRVREELRDHLTRRHTSKLKIRVAAAVRREKKFLLRTWANTRWILRTINAS